VDEQLTLNQTQALGTQDLFVNRTPYHLLALGITICALGVVCSLIMSYSPPTEAAPATALAPRNIVLGPTEDVQYLLQAALINAIPGDIIELQAGTYHFTGELNIACDNLTIRGAGHDKTILSFIGQLAGSTGITSTGNAFVIEDLAIEDTAGNAIKTIGAKDVTYRNIRVEWTNGPHTSNGAYGIYPVECQNVLIDGCISIGASDAGIYVGQSQDVVVRNCLAKQNVAGIEIENTIRADVFDNVATDNTSGILVFDLPGLVQKNGRQVRVFRNEIRNNNRENFAAKGTIVAGVPEGSGLMLMATDDVEVFDNDIVNHDTSNVILVSFLITERKINDDDYDPFSEQISIHDNRISEGGANPKGQIGMLLGPALGGRLPDIFFDGLTNPAKTVDGQLPENLRLSIRNNGAATFTNVRIGDFSPANIFSGKYRPETDLQPYDLERQPLPVTELQPHQKSSSAGGSAATVYRTAPQRLSEWKLLNLIDGDWVAADNLQPYQLNTPLFSDYTVKHRYIRLPAGQQMSWQATEALEFPVGTAIVKTFAYPDAAADPTVGERFMETRIEFREESGWYGYSYQWNEAQTDADLRLGGGVVDASWTDQRGETHSNQYQIPNANQCLSCHGQDGKYVPLGPTAGNLNGPCVADAGLNQLENWVQTGLLKAAPQQTDRPKLVTFDDEESGSIDHRARAWLDVNCAHCHNPQGSARTSGLDLTSTQADPAKFGIFKSPVAAGKGSGGRRYDIIPGKPDDSILLYRIESEEPGARMPNLARNMAHTESNQLIRNWILSMPTSETPDSMKK
jgi:parallel beta-helix repeat protein